MMLGLAWFSHDLRLRGRGELRGGDGREKKDVRKLYKSGRIYHIEPQCEVDGTIMP